MRGSAIMGFSLGEEDSSNAFGSLACMKEQLLFGNSVNSKEPATN